MMKNDLLLRLRLDCPIVLAPMGGGPGTPELAAAVSNAGGLGSLAGGYLTPEGLEAEIARTRVLTSRAINVNLFVGGYQSAEGRDAGPILELMTNVHAELELPPPVLPAAAKNPFPEQIEAVLRTRPEVFSFTFGIPSAGVMRELRSAVVVIVGTATTVQEAEMLADAGVDAVVAQGAEAGAHRGTFAGRFEESMVPTLALVRQIVARVGLPVIASGGIMTGSTIADALDAGAVAVQLGTAFLACPEAGTSPPYRQALTGSTGNDTVVTRAYSGRPARGIRNRFIELVAERDELILPFPVQNTLTRNMRAAAAKRNDAGYLSLWAGTGVAQIRPMPAAELISTLMRELREARREHD
jgi:nitronate monooxygenase